MLPTAIIIYISEPSAHSPLFTMAQMLLVDSFANARRHERASDPPRVLLQCHYDRLGGVSPTQFRTVGLGPFHPAHDEQGLHHQGRAGQERLPLQLPWLALQCHVPLLSLGKSSPTITLSHS